MRTCLWLERLKLTKLRELGDSMFPTGQLHYESEPFGKMA